MEPTTDAIVPECHGSDLALALVPAAQVTTPIPDARTPTVAEHFTEETSRHELATSRIKGVDRGMVDPATEFRYTSLATCTGASDKIRTWMEANSAYEKDDVRLAGEKHPLIWDLVDRKRSPCQQVLQFLSTVLKG